MEARNPRGEDALEVFAAWLSRREAGDAGAFAGLLGSHPDIATDLEELHATWASLADAAETDPSKRSSSASSSPAARIAELAARAGSFGRYDIEGEVARGGMGAILRVWDEDLRRHLAMKVVLGEGDVAFGRGTPHIAPRVLARFLEEAQVTSQLDHPGIVPVHELGLDSEGRVYFTMKLVEGRDLKWILGLVFEGREGWNETRALGVILKVCEAVAYAHKKGVIHRDLKPANVMVGSFGEVFVMDWGLARVLDRKDTHDLRIAPESATSPGSTSSDSPVLTMDGDVVGTPVYMPPEQARGDIERLSPRSDVYSIGAMLYHLLARQMPYVPPGAVVPNRAVLVRVLTGPPRPLHELNATVPAELAAICEKAMAHDAEERYPDTLALAEDLRAYLEHRVVGAYETGAVAELRKWVGRNKPLAAALAGCFVILLAGILFSTAKEREAESARRETAARNVDLAAATKVATQKANDVLSLSTIQELKELVEQSDALWPAFPENIAAYDEWIAKAKVLVEGRPADPARGIEGHPSLEDHRRKLAEILERAEPISADVAATDRSTSPDLPELEKERAHLVWMRRMLGEETWPSESDVETELAADPLATDVRGLNGYAWPLVDPDPTRIVYGSEVKGLLLARRAIAAAPDDEQRAPVRETLAWASYRAGRLDEALAAEEQGITEAEGSLKTLLSASLVTLKTQVASWRGDALTKRKAEAAALAARIAGLEKRVNERRTYPFDDPKDRWWHVQLQQLVADLEAFVDPQTGVFSEGLSDQHGWGVLRRRKEAASARERSVDGMDAKKRWDEAISAIKGSPKYHGLALTPQMGLLPLGPDPRSGLWEFLHVQTGDAPQRGPGGGWVVTEETGVVLVLIPGGTFSMGAQSLDPTAPNYDPDEQVDETPVHEVELSPYFLSKYELTQGQWVRICGRNPSYFGANFAFRADRIDPRHPVEDMSWTEAVQAMSRIGLSLPSEAQWENGCRAGTTTPWWTGDTYESLRGMLNAADDAYVRAGGERLASPDWLDIDDGWAAHAPVGCFPANAFGLHDTHGNVMEWCYDGFDLGFYGKSRGKDPVCPPTGIGSRVIRGGSYAYTVASARSSMRGSQQREGRIAFLGIRPAKSVAQ